MTDATAAAVALALASAALAAFALGYAFGVLDSSPCRQVVIVPSHPPGSGDATGQRATGRDAAGQAE